MLLHYTPDDGEKKTFEFKHDQMLSVEADAVERVTGLTWDEVGQKFLMGSSLVQRAVLWIFLKRENPSLRFKDLDGLRTGQVEREFDMDELQALRDNLDRKGDMLDDDERQAIENVLDSHEFESKFARIAAAEEADDPKAPKPTTPSDAPGSPSIPSKDDAGGISST